MAVLGDGIPQYLAPPVLAAIRNEDVAARVRMERSVSQEIREERADLKEAAEQSLNVILDLSLDGTVRWVSPSWRDVVGTPVESIRGQPIASILVDRSQAGAFADAVESIKKDDTRSQIIRFKVLLGPSSVFKHTPAELAARRAADGDRQDDGPDDEREIITLEGQGIMVYDRSSGGESHVRALHPVLPPSSPNRSRPCGPFDRRPRHEKSPSTCPTSSSNPSGSEPRCLPTT
jgi:serine/threonine-protein kinase RIM15